MATQEKTKTVSYRRKRNYTTSFEWTYELNQDVSKCYNTAREDPKIGYMKRMKQYWDIMHPELNHFNEKQLRQQATFVEKRKLTLDTNIPPNPVSTNAGEETAIRDNLEAGIPYTREVTTNVNIETPLEDIIVDTELFENVNNKFTRYFNVYKTRTLAQRNYHTQGSYQVKDDVWKAINNAVSTFIDENTDDVDLWFLNVVQYAAIVTSLDVSGLLKERKQYAHETQIPTWRKVLEERINNTRRKISFNMVIIKSQQDSTLLTKHQLGIKAKLKRWYGNTKQETLMAKVSLLKHDLKVLSESLRNRIKLAERNSINRDFVKKQKQIFRKWKGDEITVNEKPTQEEITGFWSGIWGEPKNFNQEAPWLRTLETEYCQDTTEKKYEISAEVFDKILRNMKNDGAPGTDLIRCYWIKKLSSTHNALVGEFKKVYERKEVLPQWLVTGRTILLPKNTETENAKNYRPIACQNITYKIFTGILNSFVVDHCVTNNIITLEQAGGKPGSWGCTDQLLINKMILDEVKVHRRNLYMMWFDYKKAFDSVPHDWIIKALQLAKIPNDIIQMIKSLMTLWSTKITLIDTTTDPIDYLCGILQGDCLSLILFILSVNPLSFLLKRLPGYSVGPPGNRTTKINHLFFVDDLKTYAQDTMTAKLQLDMINTFTQDIRMEFGKDKCAYIFIEKGKKKSLGAKLTVNEMELNELENGELYKYLGQDENVGYNDTLNKEKVTKEYFRRIRKIWSSELYSHNKTTAHNIFAIPVLTPTFGILNWTKDELQDMDVKTRKILTSTGSFHINSDIDRLYSHRSKGGRGLNSLVDIFISRTMSISYHLKEMAESNIFLSLVLNHEQERLIRVADELAVCLDIQPNQETNKKVAKQVKERIKDNHLQAWIKKPQHGYLMRTRLQITDKNESASNTWMKKSTFSSHVEGYLCAIQEEEIFTNALKSKRLKGDVSANCRKCKSSPETIQHVIACCPRLSASMYLPWRHNKVANIIYQNVIPKADERKRQPIQESFSNKDVDIWWDKKITTLKRCEHDKPDIVLWNKVTKKCFVIDICVPLDVNIVKNINMKLDNYLPLTAELKRLYNEYTFEIIPIVVGATGCITNHLAVALKKLDIPSVNDVILKCQKSALLGTLKIVKSLMKM